mgnify:CR=1 FL=1|tara:strand:- start:1112 stop:1744 length:633 start_codon:yes stop_codon:yes gene_type:complete
MPTSISGNVRLQYGNHIHNESFDSTTNAYTFANQSSQYSAGGARAVYSSGSGVAIDTGQIGSAEGLLLIKNANTSGSLSVSVDAGSNWDIKIPAGFVNLISVGPDHPIHVRTDIDNADIGVSSVSTNGTIVFDTNVSVAGTYLINAKTNPDHTSGPAFILKTTVDATTTGVVFELDGVTTKDLSTGTIYSSATVATIQNIADYRFTLTEA